MRAIADNALFGTIAADISTKGVQVLRREPKPDGNEPRRKRVAAYCRVSTDMEQQASSLETQMAAFREMISARPGWELAGIYADDGLTGTDATRRAAFQRMIADCEAGKIDYIITKSISRFARNTMDCLKYVRRLKDMGIYVYFDENRFDTGSTTSEMLISILAAVAQEESHNISENMKWGIRKRFQAGKPKWVRTYGFEKGEDGEYHINEEQARGVRRIFELCIAGRSLPQIARALEKERIPAMHGGRWWPKSLATVLRNEKYIGDVMMQKTYTVDHLSHRKVKNDLTTVPSYYVRDHHEAIIDRSTFELAGTILSLKDSHQGCTQYPYHGFLKCPFCGGSMTRFRLPTHGHPGAWTCPSAACPVYAVREEYIDSIVLGAYESLTPDSIAPLAEESNGRGEAARAALKQLSAEPRITRVEYAFLAALVDSIAFISWSEAIVTWRFGLISRVPVRYAKPSDIPCVDIVRTDEGFLANGERIACGKQASRHIGILKASCVRARRLNAHGRPCGMKKAV